MTPKLEIVSEIILIASVLFCAICTAVEYRFPLAHFWNDLHLEWALWRVDARFRARDRRRRKNAQAVRRSQMQSDEYDARICILYIERGADGLNRSRERGLK